MQPSTKYYRADGETLIDTTDGNGWFTFPLNNSIGTGTANAWVGLGTSGAYQLYFYCTGWSSTSSSGSLGDVDSNSDSSIYSSFEDCTYVNSLYCVEQP